MDISNLAPELAQLLGVQPSTLVLLLFILTSAANAGARLIPDDATGWLAAVRKICAIIGVYVPSRITSGVTVTDVAKAAVKAPPVAEKLEEVVGAPVAGVVLAGQDSIAGAGGLRAPDWKSWDPGIAYAAGSVVSAQPLPGTYTAQRDTDAGESPESSHAWVYRLPPPSDED